MKKFEVDKFMESIAKGLIKSTENYFNGIKKTMLNMVEVVPMKEGEVLHHKIDGVCEIQDTVKEIKDDQVKVDRKVIWEKPAEFITITVPIKDCTTCYHENAAFCLDCSKKREAWIPKEATPEQIEESARKLREKLDYDPRLICELCGEYQKDKEDINMYGVPGHIHYCKECGESMK